MPPHTAFVSPTSDDMAGLIRELLAHHMLEVCPDPTFVLNNDERIIVFNRAASTLGWTREELIGRNWSDIVERVDETAHIVSSNVAVSAPGVATFRAATIRQGNGSLQDVDLVTYGVRIGSTMRPSVVVVQRQRAA